ncbi:MAG: DNA-binding protein WhiA [Clostridiales bacterium]|nr:DNA-binding protein WhiA [Candidatus Crickella merdequi]
MSFSAEVKGELSRIEPKKKCCMLAEIAGFLRVAGSIRLAGGGRFSIVASTENPAIARHYKKLIKEYFDSNAELGVGESLLPGTSHKGNRYYLIISPENKSSQILRESGMLLIREGNDYFSDGIYSQVVRTKCCKKAYVRGLFLGCGTISDPRRGYHLEFVLNSHQMALDLKKLLTTFVDLSGNLTQRKDDYIVYIKKADYISDVLGIMSADDAMLEFENIRVGKGIRGEAQRMLNCDSANVDRTLSAAEEQIRWIEILKQAGQYEALSPPLLAVAELRLARPEASLTEIGEALDPPIKKPGVNKRFARIKELANRILEEKENKEEI